MVALPCKIFEGHIGHNGYGRTYRDGRMWRAHRLAWTDAHGPIPEGLVIDHLCRVRACIEVTHLEAVTQQENIRRGETGKSTGAYNRAKTHCPRGHPYSGDNLYIHPTDGARKCRECVRARQKKAS